MSTRRAELRTGWGRVLVFVYGIFAVAATGRSSLQLATQAGTEAVDVVTEHAGPVTSRAA